MWWRTFVSKYVRQIIEIEPDTGRLDGQSMELLAAAPAGVPRTTSY